MFVYFEAIILYLPIYFQVMPTHKTIQFPASRIATLDVGEMGKRKHHVCGLIEVDVTEARTKIRAHNREQKESVSFNAWLISVIAAAIREHETAAAYLKGKKNLAIFEDVNVSFLVEKEINGSRVPIPLLLEKCQQRSPADISRQINTALKEKLEEKDMLLHRKAGKLEKLYYNMPAWVRRLAWNYILRRPKMAFGKMGNVAFTSIGMMGRVNGWFIPIAVHPLCFGISSITKKPVVRNNEIQIREILNMSVLLDHDVIDGADMARFISELSGSIEKALKL